MGTVARGSAAPTAAIARRLLLERVAFVVANGGQVELAAPAGGALDGLSVHWSCSGGELALPDPDSQRALLTPHSTDWSVQATLMRGETSLGAAQARAPSTAPVAASSPLGALIRWTGGAPPVPTVDGAPVPCALVETGLCAVSASAGAVVAFPGGVVTAGAAPGAIRTELEESPDECADARFPAPLGGGIAGCSTAGVVDRHRRNPGAPRRALSLDGVPAATVARSGVTLGGSGLAVVQDRHLGLWRVADSAAYPSPELALVSPPGSDGDWLALPLDDRLQITRFGASQRRQLPASPAAQSPVHVAGRWLSWRDARAGGVQIASTEDERLGTWPGSTLHSKTLLSPGWLILSTEERTEAWGLAGQPGWTSPGDHAFGAPPVSVDDYVVLPTRSAKGIISQLVHVPTGIAVASWGSAGSWVVPRGADASGLVVHERTPGSTGQLVRLPSPIRVFEEDGRLGVSSRPQPGGHGGRHGLLAPGEQASARLHCDTASVLRAYRPGGPSDGAVLVTVADRERRYDLSGSGWVDVARLPRDTDASVRFVADADGDGLVVDALMLEAQR